MTEQREKVCVFLMTQHEPGAARAGETRVDQNQNKGIILQIIVVINSAQTSAIVYPGILMYLLSLILMIALPTISIF